MPYGSRKYPLRLSVARSQLQALERLAQRRGVSAPVAARELLAEALGCRCQQEGTRLSVTIGHREALAFAALGKRHGLGADEALEVLFAGLAECPSFVEGHLVTLGKQRRARG